MLRRAPVLVLAAAALLAPPAVPASARPRGPRRAAPLRVVRIQPRHGARRVPVAAEVRVTLNRAVDPATVLPSNLVLRRVESAGAVAWNPRVEGRGRVVVLVPAAPLAPATDYEVVAGGALASAAGAPLARGRRAMFATVPRSDGSGFLRPAQFADLPARMASPRAAHTATPVDGGRVLLAGGVPDGVTPTDTAEVFDPASETFAPLATPMREARAYHVAAQMPDGAAILVGGQGATAGALASTEWYDPVRGEIGAGPAMTEARRFHAAVVLADGRLLVTGGLSYRSDGGAAYSATAEVLTPGGSWRATAGRPVKRRAGHTLTRLANGTVLVCGGTTADSGEAATTEIFDPRTETFRLTASFPGGHRQSGAAATLDQGAMALTIDGGYGIPEVYDAALDRFFPAGGASHARRTYATATLLPGGDVLVAGGFAVEPSGTILLSECDLYVREAAAWGRVWTAAAGFTTPRAGHTATSLEDGRVLFTGGFAPGPSLDTAVIFTPDDPDAPPTNR